MIDKFLEYITVEKRYSPHTIESYRKDLSDFSGFLLQSEAHAEFEKVDKKIVRNFMVFLSTKSLSKRTINRKLSSLRSFYLFLLKIGHIEVSPLENVQSLKFYAEKQVPFSEDEMRDIHLEKFQPKNRSFLKELIVETLYQTGMRRAELINLLLENMDLEQGEIKVTGKGNKTRVIPISENLGMLFEKFLSTRKSLQESEKYFFVNEKGKKLNDNFVYRTVKSYLSVVTSKKKKSPHILRHSFATHVLEHGAPISKVKLILGHASLASTQVYTAANIEQLKKVFNRAHPRAIKK